MILKHLQMVTGYILRYEDHFYVVMEEQMRMESAGKIQLGRKQLDRAEKQVFELKRLEAEAVTLQQEIEIQERQNENLEKFIQRPTNM